MTGASRVTCLTVAFQNSLTPTNTTLSRQQGNFAPGIA
ncbi:hypothetical protein SAMN06272789_1509 [Streptomyces sp. 1331.2]|nr:hypothetical protein SAMN06272789_1509 [Streptomyces sp. 1331.2]